MATTKTKPRTPKPAPLATASARATAAWDYLAAAWDQHGQGLARGNKNAIKALRNKGQKFLATLAAVEDAKG